MEFRNRLKFRSLPAFVLKPTKLSAMAGVVLVMLAACGSDDEEPAPRRGTGGTSGAGATGGASGFGGTGTGGTGGGLGGTSGMSGTSGGGGLAGSG